MAKEKSNRLISRNLGRFCLTLLGFTFTVKISTLLLPSHHFPHKFRGLITVTMSLLSTGSLVLTGDVAVEFPSVFVGI